MSKSVGFRGVNEEIERKVPINDQLIEYGLLPEFVGRFQPGAVLDDLEEKDMIKILKESSKSILKNFEQLFETDGKRLVITEGGLKEVARISIEKGTGARALNSILELVLCDLQFDRLGDGTDGVIKITKKDIRKVTL